VAYAMSQACAVLLGMVVLPLWILVGLADWWCHRRSDIERTSGLRENLFHLALFALVAAGAVATALLDINYLVLLLLMAVFLAHELLTWIELRYVTDRRHISPFEQMVHSFLEILPLLVLAVLAVDLIAAQPVGSGAWSMRLRHDLAPGPLVAAAIAVLLLNVAPLLEETGRCLHADRRGASN
jgi:hypothetical protein